MPDPRLTLPPTVLLGVLLLAGCDAAAVKIDDSGSPDDSGDSAEVIDSGDTADTRDTADTGDTSGTDDTADTDLHDAFVVNLTGEWAGSGLSFVRINPESGVFGDAVHELAVTGARQPVALPDIPVDDLDSSPDNPDFTYALYVAGAFHDEDADGAHDPSETWITAGSVVALYVDGVLPVELAALGIRSGWNALEGAVLTAENTLSVYPSDAVPMDLPAPVERATVSGAFLDAPPSEGILSVLAISNTVIQGGTTADWLYDAPMIEGEFTVTLDGRPPDDHFSEVDESGTLADVELLISYADARPTGFDSGDAPLLPACFDGAPVVFYWFDSSPDIAVAFSFGVYGLGAGWSVLATTPEGGAVVLSEGDRSALTMSADCTL